MLGSRVLCHFFGKQLQQHLVSLLVTRRVTFTLGNQPPIECDIFLVHESVNFDLPRLWWEVHPYAIAGAVWRQTGDR